MSQLTKFNFFKFTSIVSQLQKQEIFLLKNFNSKQQPISIIRRNLSSDDSSSSSSSSSDDSLDIEQASTRLENVDNFKCLNRVTLLGRATGPAFYQQIGQTIQMATFTLVTNELRRNRSNELIKRSDFHKIQVFIPRLVDKTRKVLTKGSRVLIEGKITYNVRKNEQGGGGNQHFTNITADNIVFITGNRIMGGGQQSSGGQQHDDDLIDEDLDNVADASVDKK